MQGTMQVRWRTERPDSGYEQLKPVWTPDGSGLKIVQAWVPTTRLVVYAALDRGEMVVWNPTGERL